MDRMFGGPQKAASRQGLLARRGFRGHAEGFHLCVHSPPQVDRIWGIRGSYYGFGQLNKFYLLGGDCSSK